MGKISHQMNYGRTAAGRKTQKKPDQNNYILITLI
jgi:hypothetical protein